MKKILFIFSVWIISLLVILMSLSWNKSKEVISDDYSWLFSVWMTKSYYDQNSNEFKKIENDSKLDSLPLSDTIIFESFNPLDSVYYKSEVKNPLKITKKSEVYELSIAAWHYLFILNDEFSKYRIINENFNVTQLSKWMFLLIVNNKNSYIYPFNSTLWIELTDNWQSKAKFSIFPTLLFYYIYSNNKHLSSSPDIIRVSQIFKLFHKNPKWDVEKIFYKDNKINVINIWIINML